VLQSPLLFWLAVVTLVLWIGVAASIAVGVRSIRFLRDIPLPGIADRLPRLSVVIAARDEAAAVEQALSSVLLQQYPDFEVVVVDDRSTDGTGAILDRMAEREPRLRVVHVDAVPAGWLGKNHALHLGAQGATGELILFTDADVAPQRGRHRVHPAGLAGEPAGGGNGVQACAGAPGGRAPLHVHAAALDGADAAPGRDPLARNALPAGCAAREPPGDAAGGGQSNRSLTSRFWGRG
jgi:hypothetical protein